MALGLALVAPAGAQAADATSWRHSKSKTATNLTLTEDGHLTTNVTISFPSSSEALFSDVVFVLDTSDCVNGTFAALVGTEDAPGPLMQLQAVADETGSSVKVGVVIFKGSAWPMFGGQMVDVSDAIDEIQDMNDAVTQQGTVTASEDAVLNYISDADEDFIKKGSNMHSGLLAAYSMLKADTSVANSRKVVVTIGDGLNYYWNDMDDDGTGAVYSIYAPDNLDEKPVTMQPWFEANGQYGAYTMNNGFDYFFGENGTARTHMNQDGTTYVVNMRDIRSTLQAAGKDSSWGGIRTLTDNDGWSVLAAAGTRYVADTELTGVTYDGSAGSQWITTRNAAIQAHANSFDWATIKCLDTYQDMADEGYRMYAYTSYGDNYGENTFPYQFIAHLNGIAGVTTSNAFDSDDIYKQILYLLGPGSEVEDVIGADFDLPDRSSMTMTVGSTTYTAVDLGDDNWGFKEDAGVTDGYDYVVSYANQDGTETLTWKTNVNVSNFERVSLNYTLELANPETEPGTYGTYDEDGSEGYTSLYTNEGAVLRPVDSSGNPGTDEAFGKPTVSYVVVGVDKSWSDGADAHTGDSVLVGVTDSGLDGYAGYIYVTAGSNWYGSVALPLPVGAYGVEEVETSATGYAATYGGSLEDGFTVTNTAPGSGDNGSGAGDNGSGTSTTTTTTTKAGRKLPFTGDPATLAGVLATLAAGSGALAVGVRRRGRR